MGAEGGGGGSCGGSGGSGGGGFEPPPHSPQVFAHSFATICEMEQNQASSVHVAAAPFIVDRAVVASAHTGATVVGLIVVAGATYNCAHGMQHTTTAYGNPTWHTASSSSVAVCTRSLLRSSSEGMIRPAHMHAHARTYVWLFVFASSRGLYRGQTTARKVAGSQHSPASVRSRRPLLLPQRARP